MNYNSFLDFNSDNHQKSPLCAENNNRESYSISTVLRSSSSKIPNERTLSYSEEQEQAQQNKELIYKPVFSNSEEHSFQSFLYETCSPYVDNINFDFISKLHKLIPHSDTICTSIFTQSLPNLKIQQVQRLPFYKGSALGITTMSSKKRKDLFRHGSFDQNQLQWNLLKLYFSYFNQFFFVIHPTYFYRQLVSRRSDKSFRFLLLVVLSLATSYLHIEPYEGAPDPGELCEAYLNEALELFEELKHIPSQNTLIATILLCNINYSKINASLADAWAIANQLGFATFFNTTSEKILKTMPNFPDYGPPTDKYLEWEQNLILWCNLVFNCLLSCIAGMPVQVPVESKFLDITEVINVLYHENRVKCFAEKEEIEVLKHTYLLDPIFLEILRFRNTHSQNSKPSLACLNLQERELREILGKMRKWDFEFNLSIKNLTAKPNNIKLNIMISTAFRFRQFVTLFLTTPYLAVIQSSNSSSLQNPYLLDDSIFWELSSSCISIILSFWAEGDLFSLIGSGIRNYMLFVAWGGAQAIYKLLDKVLSNMKAKKASLQEQSDHQDYPQNSNNTSNKMEKKISEYEFLKRVFTAIIPLPLKSLLKSIPISFHHRPIDLLLEQQSAHFWCLVNPQHKKMLSKYITISELKYRKNPR